MVLLGHRATGVLWELVSGGKDLSLHNEKWHKACDSVRGERGFIQEAE